jgi:outer membrane murein-binding lipoprotein Lpp
MSDSHDARLWEVETLRKKVEQLQSESSDLRAEVARLSKSREVDRQLTSKLRAHIQSAHHREKALKELYAKVRGSDTDEGLSQLEGVPGGPDDRRRIKRERVDPSLIERLPAREEEEAEADWLDPASTLPALPPHPGWGNYESAGEQLVVIGVSLLGLERDEQARIINLVARQQLRNRTFAPVFLTDDDDFRALREEHFIFEYLPPWPGPDLVPTRQEWDDFLLRRLELIRGKWGVRRFVYFSSDAISRVGALTSEAFRSVLDDEAED